MVSNLLFEPATVTLVPQPCWNQTEVRRCFVFSENTLGSSSLSQLGLTMFGSRCTWLHHASLVLARSLWPSSVCKFRTDREGSYPYDVLSICIQYFWRIQKPTIAFVFDLFQFILEEYSYYCIAFMQYFGFRNTKDISNRCKEVSIFQIYARHYKANSTIGSLQSHRLCLNLCKTIPHLFVMLNEQSVYVYDRMFKHSQNRLGMWFILDSICSFEFLSWWLWTRKSESRLSALFFTSLTRFFILLSPSNNPSVHANCKPVTALTSPGARRQKQKSN